MGSLTLRTGGLAYLDANCIVYRVERIEPYCSLLVPLFDAAESGALGLITSELTVLECLVKPLRVKDQELVKLFRAVLRNSREIRLAPISTAVIETALRVRAEHGFKTPDAIHAATALETGCAAFYTNDLVFPKLPGLNALVLREALG